MRREDQLRAAARIGEDKIGASEAFEGRTDTRLLVVLRETIEFTGRVLLDPGVSPDSVRWMAVDGEETVDSGTLAEDGTYRLLEPSARFELSFTIREAFKDRVVGTINRATVSEGFDVKTAQRLPDLDLRGRLVDATIEVVTADGTPIGGAWVVDEKDGRAYGDIPSPDSESVIFGLDFFGYAKGGPVAAPELRYPFRTWRGGRQDVRLVALAESVDVYVAAPGYYGRTVYGIKDDTRIVLDRTGVPVRAVLDIQGRVPSDVRFCALVGGKGRAAVVPNHYEFGTDGTVSFLASGPGRLWVSIVATKDARNGNGIFERQGTRIKDVFGTVEVTGTASPEDVVVRIPAEPLSAAVARLDELVKKAAARVRPVRKRRR